MNHWFNGALAQLGERLHGMQEVSGSIPLCSTKPLSQKTVFDMTLRGCRATRVISGNTATCNPLSPHGHLVITRAIDPLS